MYGYKLSLVLTCMVQIVYNSIICNLITLHSLKIHNTFICEYAKEAYLLTSGKRLFHLVIYA